LPFLSESLGMNGAVFADAGSLFNAAEGANVVANLADDSAVRASVGASIIWDSPLGPLRFDYAFPLAKQDYDEIQEFRFGASTRF
jgi:outer membrane protein insertion porin family